MKNRLQAVKNGGIVAKMTNKCRCFPLLSQKIVSRVVARIISTLSRAFIHCMAKLVATQHVKQQVFKSNTSNRRDRIAFHHVNRLSLYTSRFERN